MAIQLDEPEVQARAERLAQLKRISVEQLIADLLKEKEQEFDWGERDSAEYLAAKFAWFAELDARPRTLDPRSWREVEEQELYDEFGCPI